MFLNIGIAGKIGANDCTGRCDECDIEVLFFGLQFAMGAIFVLIEETGFHKTAIFALPASSDAYNGFTPVPNCIFTPHIGKLISLIGRSNPFRRL